MHSEARSSHDVGAADRVLVVGHSQLLFWWPVWAYGFFMVFWSYFYDPGTVGQTGSIYTILSLIYIMLLLFVITFTNLRLAPSFFLIFVLCAIIVIILVKQQTMTKIFPFLFNSLRTSMNFEFYLVMSSALLCVWLLSFFVYDRGVKWSIRRGQVNFYHMYRHTDDEMINAMNANFTRKLDDFVCHWILGLGLVGDIYVRFDNGRVEQMRNVIHVRALTSEIEKIFR